MQAKQKRTRLYRQPVKIHETVQNSPEWHELRKTRITASSAIKLLTGTFSWFTEPIKQNRAMRRGHELEPEAIELYEQINEVDVLKVGFVTNKKYPNAGASPDAVLGDRLIEVKCFNPKKHRAAAKELPVEVIAQVQMQMLICELDRCDVVLYNPDLEAEEALHIIPVYKDERIQSNIVNKLQKAPLVKRERTKALTTGVQCIV